MVGAVAGTVTVTPPGQTATSVQALIEINTMPTTSVVSGQTVSNNYSWPDPFNTSPPQNVMILANSGLQIFARGLNINLSSGQSIHGDFNFAIDTGRCTIVRRLTMLPPRWAMFRWPTELEISPSIPAG